jgi:hypothetical protein
MSIAKEILENARDDAHSNIAMCSRSIEHLEQEILEYKEWKGREMQRYKDLCFAVDKLNR